MTPGKLLACIALVFASGTGIGQNEYTKWYFGNKAGLDFMTSPPSVLTNGMLNSYESCSSIADGNGNLLFYTDGITVWNKNHQVMANGTFLLGDSSATQSGMIVKQPGQASKYYIFTIDDWGGSIGLRYSIVDMSLASGNGSVIAKDVSVYTPSTEKITAARHCNGTDIWIISHEWNSGNFVSHLLTSAGLSTSPVISAAGPLYGPVAGQNYAAVGCMKASPNGKRLGVAGYWGFSGFDIYDFDNSTGVVSNQLLLLWQDFAYGAEFSPDGSKFYGSFTDSGDPAILQWDLCAGSSTAILASQYTVASINCSQMQRGPDGRIYIAAMGSGALSVINNPNAAGSACNFSNGALSLSPATSKGGLPQMPLTRSLPPPFTYTGGCTQATFSAPPSLASNTSCAMNGFSLTSLIWNFGDPAAGPANVSTSVNPVHQFIGTGPFTVQLVMNYSCGGGSDTIRQVVPMSNVPVISVSGQTMVCWGGTTTLTASGASNYTWNTGSNASALVVTPAQSTNYTVTAGNGTCTASKVIQVIVSECLRLESAGTLAGIQFFPNPVKDELHIECDGKTEMALTDMSGRVLNEYSLNSGRNTVSTADLSPGVYLVLFSDGNRGRVAKLVKSVD
jgi:hypothetical protein